MKRLSALYVMILLTLSSMIPLLAQGEATVLFLMINPGARQGGMGEAGVALADDANATYWNPAGLAFQYEDPELDSKAELTAMHVNWLPQFNLSDLYYDFFSARYYLDNVGMIGGSIQFINYGENTQTAEDGAILGRFNSNEVALTGSYALKLTNSMSFGVNLKFIYSRLSPVNVSAEVGKGVGSSFAVDLGYLYFPSFAKRLSLGANLSNMGPKVTYIDKQQADPLPTNLRLGLGYRLVDSEFNSLTLVYDINRLLVPRDRDKRDDSFLTYVFNTWSDGSDQFKRLAHAVGLEYWYTDLIALRTGYFYEDPDFGDRKFWTFGGGVNISVFGVDFSYILATADDHPLSDTIRFSLTGRF